jgi:hypothetical protein
VFALGQVHLSSPPLGLAATWDRLPPLLNQSEGQDKFYISEHFAHMNVQFSINNHRILL